MWRGRVGREKRVARGRARVLRRGGGGRGKGSCIVVVRCLLFEAEGVVDEAGGGG